MPPPAACGWTYTAGRIGWGNPTVVGGTVYVGGENGEVYALNAATGHLRRTYATGDPGRTDPTVTDGVVYLGTDDGKVYALDAATVYVGSEDCKVFALNAIPGRVPLP